jgi:allophanate hydrolase
MSARNISVCGDDLIAVAADSPAAAQQIARHLRASGRFRETVAGIASVVVQFDAARVDLAEAARALNEALGENFTRDEPAQGCVEIPIVYGGESGPDFASLCEQLDLTRGQFIALHTRDEYRVEMLGFTPGFAYIGGLDEKLNVPRLAEPRVRVAAGSVGIAGGKTGLYALAGPGGWRIIGRTSLLLFDRDSTDPFLIEPGMRIRFRAIDEPET